MKKLVCLLAVIALTAPLYAAEGDPNVVITCADEGSGVCKVSYAVQVDTQTGDPGLVRGFALDIEVSGNATITDVGGYDQTGTATVAPDNYGVFVGQIDFGTDPNNVYDWGSPLATTNTAYGTIPGATGMTVELASLYEVGVDTPPAASGDLLTFTVDFGGDTSTTVTITANALRGEIVMEDIQHANIIAPGCTLDNTPTECMAATNPDYDTWVSVGSPECWCYERNCRGDTNDAQEYDMFWVLNIDVDNYAAAYGQTVMTGNMICADFARDIEYDMFRVLNNDLPILVAYYGDTATPPCSGPGSDTGNGEDTNPLPNSHFNFWTHP